jgi:branched-chain amino acid transport system substrate-binding protein
MQPENGRWLVLASVIVLLLHCVVGAEQAKAPTGQTYHTAVAQQVAPAPPIDPNAIVIGLDADISSGNAESGEAIRRGIVLAFDELNHTGGLLGRPLQLVVRDHQGNPARGVDNMEAFARMGNLVAVVGGIHSPVALAELETVHRHRLIFLVPWAAGTSIIDNHYTPNFAFRVSARDEYVGAFLVEQALHLGYQRPGLLLEQTAWGNSNEKALVTAFKKHDISPVGTEWFFRGVDDITDVIATLRSAGADVLILVSSAPEGIVAMHSMAALPQAHRLPIISHWGITGAGKRFVTQVGDSLSKVDLVFLQTFSFLAPPFPERAKRLSDAYCATFPGCRSARDIFSPVGTVQAYELIHLLALAIQQAGTLDRSAVRDALENLPAYAGLIRNYAPPFTAGRHDALDATDFRLARYDSDGATVPLLQGK